MRARAGGQWQQQQPNIERKKRTKRAAEGGGVRRANKGTQRYDDGQEPKRFHVAGKNYSSDELLQPLPARALYDCLADGHNGLPLSLSLFARSVNSVLSTKSLAVKTPLIPVVVDKYAHMRPKKEHPGRGGHSTISLLQSATFALPNNI